MGHIEGICDTPKYEEIIEKQEKFQLYEEQNQEINPLTDQQMQQVTRMNYKESEELEEKYKSC